MRAQTIFSIRSLRRRAVLAAVLVVFSLFASGCVQNFNAFLNNISGDESEPHGVAMLVVDPDPKGTNVRETPGGKIITVIPHGGKTADERAMRRVMVTAQEKDWLRVRLDDGTSGWMHCSVLGARAVAGKGGNAPLRLKPEADSPVAATLKGGADVTLLEVKGTWARVQYTSASGKKTAGWMAEHDLSANPHTDLPSPAAARKKEATQKTATAPKTPVRKTTAESGPTTKKPAASKTATPEKTEKKTAAASVSGQAVAASVQKQIGVKYIWSGTTPKGFDCSGLMYYTYKQHNITIPRTSREQAKAGKAVAKKDLKPGDLVFFAKSASSPIDHVGMYIGNDTIIHAPNPDLPVITTRLSDYSFVRNGQRNYFQGVYITGRRVLP